MGHVQFLRERAREGASAKGVHVPAGTRVRAHHQIKDCTKDRCTTEIGRWFVK